MGQLPLDLLVLQSAGDTIDGDFQLPTRSVTTLLWLSRGGSGCADNPVNGHSDGSKDTLFSGHAAGVVGGDGTTGRSGDTGRVRALSGQSRHHDQLTAEHGEDLASDVALQAAEDLFVDSPCCAASSFDVGGGAGFALGDRGQHDVPQGAVGVAVPAWVQPVPAGAFAAVGWQWCDTTAWRTRLRCGSVRGCHRPRPGSPQRHRCRPRRRSTGRVVSLTKPAMSASSSSISPASAWARRARVNAAVLVE